MTSKERLTTVLDTLVTIAQSENPDNKTGARSPRQDAAVRLQAAKLLIDYHQWEWQCKQPSRVRLTSGAPPHLPLMALAGKSKGDMQQFMKSLVGSSASSSQFYETATGDRLKAEAEANAG